MMKYTLPERARFPSDKWINNNMKHSFPNEQKAEHIYIKTQKYIPGSLLYAVLQNMLLPLYWESQ